MKEKIITRKDFLDLLRDHRRSTQSRSSTRSQAEIIVQLSLSLSWEKSSRIDEDKTRKGSKLLEISRFLRVSTKVQRTFLHNRSVPRRRDFSSDRWNSNELRLCLGFDDSLRWDETALKYLLIRKLTAKTKQHRPAETNEIEFKWNEHAGTNFRQIDTLERTENKQNERRLFQIQNSVLRQEFQRPFFFGRVFFARSSTKLEEKQRTRRESNFRFVLKAFSLRKRPKRKRNYTETIDEQRETTKRDVGAISFCSSFSILLREETRQKFIRFGLLFQLVYTIGRLFYVRCGKMKREFCFSSFQEEKWEKEKSEFREFKHDFRHWTIWFSTRSTIEQFGH